MTETAQIVATIDVIDEGAGESVKFQYEGFATVSESCEDCGTSEGPCWVTFGGAGGWIAFCPPCFAAFRVAEGVTIECYSCGLRLYHVEAPAPCAYPKTCPACIRQCDGCRGEV